MISEARIDEATDWFMRIRSEGATAEDFVPLQQWLGAHPDNAAAYRKVCAMWSAMDDIATSPEVMGGRRDALDDAHRVQQRRGFAGARTRLWQALAASVVAVALFASLMAWMHRGAGTVYETGVGERRELTLSDGSQVTLDARTRIDVRYSDDTRAIRLESGQASFKVSRNPARPFRVSSSGQTVVALGTEFNVEVVPGEVVVTLIEGRVAVVPDATPSSRAIELTEGQQLLSAAGALPRIRSHVDLGHTVAWQSGKIFFNDEPLSSAVTRINRYAASPLEVDASVEHIRIGGTFKTDDTTAFTDAVSSYFPVKVVKTASGTLRLTARVGP